MPGKFTFYNNQNTSSGGSVTSTLYGPGNDNGYGFVLTSMGASRSPDSSMYSQAYMSSSVSNRYRRMMVNADYWYDGNFHEIGVLDTSTNTTVNAYVNPSGRMVSARGPYINIGIADQYQD